ncbi:hypothetical protein [Streptomyces sp. 1114.5]|uniref:hypothetical protein n=1 Tax=Streptomyces sp. 1114.5 TaxID=1938830 RepID=UPI00217CDE29|nr:hypothetical protein [Streptomyces sp. 1114.5]
MSTVSAVLITPRSSSAWWWRSARTCPGRDGSPRAVRGGADAAADSAARWGAAHGVRTGRAGTWTQAHRRWLALAALLVVVPVFALWNHPTVLTVLLLVLVLLAVLAVLALLAASGRAATTGEPPVPGRPGPGE